MATINGTITGVTLLAGNPAGVGGRKTYLLAVDVPAYTSGSDDLSITGVLTAINAATKNGKTLTLRGGLCCYPGRDTNAQAVYAAGASVNALTLANPTTTGDFTGELSDAAVAELTATASTGMGVIAIVDEA